MSAVGAGAHHRAPPAETVPRLLAGLRADGRAVSLTEHVERHGPLRFRDDLIELVEESGLLGRGGGSFPSGRKLRAVANARGRPVVLLNGVEGEPVSGKDQSVLAYVPHLALDGAAAAAAALRAKEVIVAVGGGGHVHHAIREALAERKRRRVDGVPFSLAVAPARFVAGEETALVNFVNGGEAKPTFTPPRPFERGVRGAPTLVQNAETFAHIGLIARNGPDWFRARGTHDEPGTTLVTLNGAVRRPGVYEIPLGLPFRELLQWAGGTSAPVSAYLVGGYFGAWIAADQAEPLRLLDADLRQTAAGLGARAIVALPASVCGVAETARVARYLSDESAGQCGPCVNGLDAVAGALERLAHGRADDTDRLEHWLRQLPGRGACRHPDGAARLIASALRVFSGELELHRRGSCSGRGRPLLPVGT